MFSLNPGQIRQLLGAVNVHSAFGKRDYLLILFLYQTGLRVGECSHLITQMVYSQGKAREWLHLPAAVCKSSRGRVVPLNALARVCIEKQVRFNQQRGFSTAPAAPLFQNSVHGPLSVRSIQKLIKGYREAADLDLPATPHTLRHSMATGMVANGAVITSVKEILGHRQLSSTQVYTHAHVAQSQRDSARLGD